MSPALALPECDTPAMLYDELLEEIRSDITNHPRTLQTRIGPSEVGNPCSRALIASVMEIPGPVEPPNLRAWVGVAMHEKLERIFANSPCNVYADGRPREQPRYLLEKLVTVGAIGGVVITGSCDLFDTGGGAVWDWKSKSKTQLQKHKRHGPGETYRVQRHCYGAGMVAQGHRVNTVGCVFLPRDGEFSDICYDAEPFDPQVAVDAFARANRLHTLASAFGVEAAQQLFPACDDEFCRTCGNYRAPFGAPKSVASSTAELFSV